MTHVRKIILAVAIALWGCALPVHAGEIKLPLLSVEQSRALLTCDTGGDERKCVISRDTCLGGIENYYISAAKVFYENHVTLVIDALIGSACITTADRLLYLATEIAPGEAKVEDIVCLKPRAVFVFHQPFRFLDENKGFVPGNLESLPLVILSPNLKVAVDNLGKLPLTRDILQAIRAKKILSFEQLSPAIFPTCGGQVAAD